MFARAFLNLRRPTHRYSKAGLGRTEIGYQPAAENPRGQEDIPREVGVRSPIAARYASNELQRAASSVRAAAIGQTQVALPSYSS